jgi:Flp pilus assembly protein TadG
MRVQKIQRSVRRAASLVEFAVVAQIFFMLLFGIVEYSRFLFTIQMVNNAAREGARYAVVNTTEVTTAQIQSYVDAYLMGQGATQFVSYSPSSNITVYMADPVTGANLGGAWQDAGWGTGIGVQITGTYQPIVPDLISMSKYLTIRGTCVMTSEAN